jgi:molecular chaperone GrpE
MSKREKKAKAEVTENAVSAEEFEKIAAQSADYMDKWHKSVAELDNFRRRTAAEKAGMYDNGMKDAFLAMLPVLDNFERAITAVDAEANADNALYKGLVQIIKQFAGVLEEYGVNEIEALGKPFDPNVHAAVSAEDNEEYGANTVCGVLMKGYMYKGKVLRHSMVKVTN